MTRPCPVCGRVNRVPPAHLADTGRCGACKASLPPVDVPIDADSALFDAVLREARVPVLVDFWAAWCGPCRMAAPEVAAVASDMTGRAIVVKVDTERHPELAARYGVRGIPHFVVLHRGGVVQQQSGLVGRDELRRLLETAARA